MLAGEVGALMGEDRPDFFDRVGLEQGQTEEEVIAGPAQDA